MIQINPYICFNGKCREAMNFYQECLGGELSFQTIGESPMAAQCPEGIQDQILHSMLANGSLVLMATDITPPEGYKPGNDISISLNFDEEEETRQCFEKLSLGGKVIEPLKEQFWGAIFGVVQDRFGKVWMLNYENNNN
ncbi:VOC family protein [Rapidithrix thailandica]|uniref:VOC family protein n=1 Tax=Rapidithrix thailandica TaxID=413964 RepID=A0AAW9SAZ5_9BACT